MTTYHHGDLRAAVLAAARKMVEKEGLAALSVREAARRLNLPFGIIDLSLAPTPVIGDSVADIIEAMGFERAGTHGTTAALALLTDAVKKGGAMASGSVGGMSGAFIPVSEDASMIEAARVGALGFQRKRELLRRLSRDTGRDFFFPLERQNSFSLDATRTQLAG